jgi:ABC-type spermidine/putrescine transport system permease subunit II
MASACRRESLIWLLVTHCWACLSWSSWYPPSSTDSHATSEEAAQNLGANEVETFFEVTLPLLKRSILAGMMFAFVSSLQEYPATQAWASPDFYTLPIVMYNKIRDQLSPEINVIGVLMIAFAVVVVLVYQGRASAAPAK